MGRDVSLFDRYARLYDRLMPAADRAVLRAGLQLAERPVALVLDVGGGTGRAARRIPGPERIVVDAAQGMLRQARHHGLAGVRADAARLPVPDASVDAVLIVDALHHIPDQGGTLAEAARVLRPGGVLVVREFDRGTIRGRLLAVAEHAVGFDSTFFTPAELRRAVERVGLVAQVPDRGFAYTVTGVRR